MKNSFLVTEKLDGSCEALASQGFMASRWKITASLDLSNEAEMKEVLGSTKSTSLILTSLAKHLKTDLPALRGELRKEVKSELLKVVVYGINKGTATRSGN